MMWVSSKGDQRLLARMTFSPALYLCTRSRHLTPMRMLAKRLNPRSYQTVFLDPNFICYLAPAIPLDPQSCSRSAHTVPTFPRDSTFERRTQCRNVRQ